MIQDFRNQNLSASTFKRRDLTGANFSGADIRGVNFSGAHLENANFNQVKAGLSSKSSTLLFVLKSFLSLFSGTIIAYAGTIWGHLFVFSNLGMLILAISIAVALILFGSIAFKKGLGLALGLISLIAATAIVLSVAITVVFSIKNAEEIAISSLALGGSMAGVIGLGQTICLSRSVKSSVAVALVGMLFGALLGISEATPIADLIGVLLVSINAMILAVYMGKQALRDDPRYHLLSTLAINLSTAGGTSFRGANLTNANFTGATLSSTDFREANLTRTCWLNAELSRANLDRTYLESATIRHLLTTGNGAGRSLKNLNLRGVSLQGANLSDADLEGTDLSNATLQGADLSNAKLFQAQLHGANLSEACLTGAFIQNWGISTETDLNNVKCDYIFTRRPTKNDPDGGRKPDNRDVIFQPSDFSDFITPIIKVLDLYQKQNADLRAVGKHWKTLDLVHYSGLDPTAAAIAVAELSKKHPEANLELRALEGRGREKIRLQVVVDDQADSSELYAEYFAKYEQLKSLPYNDIQAILVGFSEKDDRIRGLEKLIGNAVQQPKFYIETHGNQGAITMSESKGNINISGTQGNVSGVTAAGENLSIIGSAIGAISGNVTNTVNQLPDSPTPEPGIKELLKELQAAIEADSTLNDDDKAEALEQVQTIAKGGTQPQDGLIQKTVKTAMKVLKGTIADLPSTEQLVKVSLKVLPLIAGFFGLVA
jgi:uncharacterized protein YjbI with pentapeptide repeats